MSRFVFELEAVLRMRLREEERAMLALAAAESKRSRHVNTAKEIEARATTGRLEWRDRLVNAGREGGIEMTAVRMQAGSTLRELASLKRAALSVAAAERDVEIARASLLEAMKRRRAIDDLRERRLQEWRAALVKVEQRAIDDLVVSRHGRALDGLDGSIEGEW